MSKVVFLDVDGTLVTYENRIPASAVAAVAGIAWPFVAGLLLGWVVTLAWRNQIGRASCRERV